MLKKPAAVYLYFILLLPLPVLAQQSRITGRIDDSQRVTLHGHLHPKASPQFDQGAVDPSLRLPRVTLMLQPSASQQADLDQLLAEQQDPSSPNYHRWLTPEQYADRFGVSQTDVDKIVAWLGSQNLTVAGVARGRNWIAVSGTAGAVEQAFRTQIHHYLVNGELHFANAIEPSIPASLQGVVTSIRGLTDFRLKPAWRPRSSRPFTAQPQYNNASLCDPHCIGPDDLATIYNLTPLFNASLTGSGQKLAVVGQSQVRMTDIEQYRSFFNLPANDPQPLLVPGDTDPGIVNGDLGESELDLEISGAVARNAAIIFVYSSDVMTSAQYAIDQNLAPVLSISYGDCEAAYAPSDVSSLEAMAKQANAEGITWFAASGDNGATDCYGDGFPGANSIVSVDMPASLPELTGIGGNEFTDGSGNYWSASNTANNASALSYIPETAWNDSAIDGSPSASGGGASRFFTKPSWQTGTGVPGDNARDVPDLSISASADHDGYLIFTSDSCGSRRGTVATCEGVVGGTSVGPPAFAGFAVLLNQSLVSRGLQSSPGLGNINPALYNLAETSPAAFHDITTGNNVIDVTCTFRQQDCTAGPMGFNAGPGYDQVTGIGSVDASALMTAWIAGLNQHTTSPTNPPAITGIANAGSYAQAYAPGEIISIFGSQLSSSTQTSATTPLPTQMAGVTVTIGGLAAPLWYVSPGQLNVQIPYEIPVNTSVVVTVTNNGQSASTSFVAAAAAPGIFTDQNGAPVPNSSAAQGQVITLYITGAGAVSPAQADGAAPAAGTPLDSLPVPVQNVTVSVGGVDAPMEFVGIPWGLVGTTQINYQVPAGAPLGAQPVVVTVGGIPSNTAFLTVTQ
jgi:uncharacterized protein (TIGR03437 family)